MQQKVLRKLELYKQKHETRPTHYTWYKTNQRLCVYIHQLIHPSVQQPIHHATSHLSLLATSPRFLASPLRCPCWTSQSWVCEPVHLCALNFETWIYPTWRSVCGGVDRNGWGRVYFTVPSCVLVIYVKINTYFGKKSNQNGRRHW